MVTGEAVGRFGLGMNIVGWFGFTLLVGWVPNSVAYGFLLTGVIGWGLVFAGKVLR